MRLPAVAILLLLSGKIVAQVETNEKVKPLILIDTLFTYNESMILHPSKIVSIYTVNAVKATQLYGVPGRFGLIRIQTVPDIHLARLSEILDKFKVEEKYRNLRVCIDRVIVMEPEKILADLNEIRTVEIVTEKPAANDATLKDLSFINIITHPGF